MKDKYSFTLPENVIKIINLFREKGYRADVVGGCIRDFLLGLTPSDFDITTVATPEEMKIVLRGFKTVDTGINHGTLTVILGSASYEITTYRIDGEYVDNRHPASVTFSRDIENDLSRRDFTVNAIAYNPYDGLTDLFFGIYDIERKIIRCVGNPDLRFDEDALRILRAIRFASTLGFTLEAKTAKSAIEHRALLSKVSNERIYSEWRKLLMGKNTLSVIREYLRIINVFLPCIHGVGALTPESFEALDFVERQCALFLVSSAGAKRYSDAMKRLRSDAKTRKTGVAILEAAESILKQEKLSSDQDYLRALAKFGDALIGALRILEAVGLSHGSSKRASALSKSGKPYRIADLAINGDDVKASGIKGEKISIKLNELLYKIIDGELDNTREQLLEYLDR